jgi:hypothetical protein
MRRSTSLLTALGFCCLCAHPVAGQAPRPIGIAHVTVIDVEHGRRLRDQTIVIEGTHIATVGPSSQVRIPDGYGVVEGRGKFVIPGLVDMQVPLVRDADDSAVLDSTRRALASFVPFGVTTIREASPRDVDVATFGWRDIRDDAGMPIPRISFAERQERASLAASGGTDGSDLVQWLNEGGVGGIVHLSSVRPLGSNRRDDSPPVDTSDRPAARFYRDADWLYEDTAFTDSLIHLMVRRRAWLEPALVSEELTLTTTEELLEHPGRGSHVSRPSGGAMAIRLHRAPNWNARGKLSAR